MTSTSAKIFYSKTLSNKIVELFLFVSPKILLQAKNFSNRNNNNGSDVDDFKNVSFVSESNFDNDFVWKVENLPPFSNLAVRITIILSENYPEVPGIESRPSNVIKTGLSRSAASAPILQSVQQVPIRSYQCQVFAGLFYKLIDQWDPLTIDEGIKTSKYLMAALRPCLCTKLRLIVI